MNKTDVCDLCDTVARHDAAADHFVGEIHLNDSSANLLDLHSLFYAQTSAVDARCGRIPGGRLAHYTPLEHQVSDRPRLHDAVEIIDKTIEFGVADGRIRIKRAQASEVDRGREFALMCGMTWWKGAQETVCDETRCLQLRDRQCLGRLSHTHTHNTM